ncbi:MAG: isoprenyl synthetase [Bacteroidia bacterium]|nr:MAG: isoprenyl synthetase [Bacteroidia bacterium]
MNIKINTYQKAFLNYITRYSKNLDKRSPKELYQPIQYILDSDAKHIRPILCLLAYNLYESNYKNALNAALAIELFHTFSLVHDDILDNASLRRGKKTIHEKWNTNIAILSGDVLLTESFRLLSNYSPSIAQQLLKVFSEASVLICEGQQEDMNFEKLVKVTTKQYLEMIRKKTGVLIGTSLQMGAIVANVSLNEQKKLYKIGENIGLAFQIMDDYLDTFGDSKLFGKKIGNDILSNKKTFLLTKAFETSNSKQLQKLYKFLKMPPSKDKIIFIKQLFLELGINEIALKTAQEINKKNEKLIQSLSSQKYELKQTLRKLSNELINRTK